jgi:hypothetical protein
MQVNSSSPMAPISSHFPEPSLRVRFKSEEEEPPRGLGSYSFSGWSSFALWRMFFSLILSAASLLWPGVKNGVTNQN